MPLTLDDDLLEDRSRPIVESILGAHVSRDYDQLFSLFDHGDGVHIPTREQFNEAVAQAIEPLGSVVSITYLGSVSKKHEVLLLWKARFERGPEELLWHLYVGEDMKVTAIWFG